MDVHIACSGEMAIDIAYEKRPDLIVLDVMMPGLDGPATFARIRESPLIADTPIVFMTARVMPSEIDSLMELGAIGVIGKPFDPLRLGAELTALWNQASATREVSARRDGQGEVLAQVDALAERFVERTRDDVDRLRMLARCARSDGRPALKEIERIAHSIHGAGLMFGFAAVSKLGAAIEHLAGSWLMGPEPTAVPGDSTALRLNQLTEQLSRVLGRAPRKSATVFGRPGATAKPT
jgi:CheY-like chemotaxis protein